METKRIDEEDGAALGDPRRCQRHGTVTSSPDGMFDTPCGHCESEMEMDNPKIGESVHVLTRDSDWTLRLVVDRGGETFAIAGDHDEICWMNDCDRVERGFGFEPGDSRYRVWR